MSPAHVRATLAALALVALTVMTPAVGAPSGLADPVKKQIAMELVSSAEN